MRVALVLVLAGCYGPSVSTGAPCDPAAGAQACPSGQMCVPENGAMFCEATAGGGDAGGGGDAADAPTADGSDASTAFDMDGDGVIDLNDDCPTVSNADQGNEDGDKFGDACDPCPPVADDNPPDADGDGVADACDPHPQVGGDTIVLFEGFHHGIPAGWTQTGGTWTASGDEVAMAAATDQISLLTVPSPATTKHETVSAAFVLSDAALGGARSIGVLDDTDHAAGAGVMCGPYIPGPKRVEIYDLGAGTVVTDGFAFTNGDVITIKLRRDLQQFGCDAISPQIEKMPNASDPTDVATPEIGLRVHTLAGSFKWLMVVNNP